MRNEGGDNRASGQVLGEQRVDSAWPDRGHGWLANREASRRGTSALASSDSDIGYMACMRSERYIQEVCIEQTSSALC